MNGVNYVCNAEGKVIGEYFYDEDLKCFVTTPQYGLPHYCRTAIRAIDIIEDEERAHMREAPYLLESKYSD